MEVETSTCNVYEALDKLFTEEHSAEPSSFLTKIHELFPHSVRKEWPSIGSEAGSKWKEGPVLVRARCMVQDSLGSEFYAASCQVTKGDVKRIASGVLRDTFGDETLTETLNHGTRHCYVMVPVPCATEWYRNQFEGESIDNTSESKRPKLEATEKPVLERFVAKFLDDAAESLRVNSVMDVYGVMSGHGFQEGAEGEEDTSSSTNLAGVPNLHVIHYEEVKQGEEALSSTPLSSVMPRLRSLLEECVVDQLAADYIAMHLISSTYARADNATICALPLNVCGVREGREMEEIVKELVGKMKSLPLTSSSLSSSPFHSVKDYKTNRLQMGQLQLSDGTHLIIDETVTPKGKIEVNGHAESNLGTLHKVISEQKIEYEFGFYRCPFDVDLPVMVLSEERSRFVGTPYRICLPSGPSPSSSPIHRLSEGEKREMREGIVRAKAMLKEVTVSGDVAKAIQSEFVSMCTDPSAGLTSDAKADKLSQLLIMTRLETVLRGESEMAIDSWRTAVLMEKRREEELNARFPPPPTPADFAAENKEN